MKMCFNWKVLAGLGVVGVGIYLVAPTLVLGALPLLLLAACPLSMLVMMKGMHGMGESGATSGQCQPQPQAVDAAPSRAEQLAQLRAQVRDVTEQQAALARQLEHLQTAEAPAAPPSRALQEAEQVARAADGQR